MNIENTRERERERERERKREGESRRGNTSASVVAIAGVPRAIACEASSSLVCKVLPNKQHQKQNIIRREKGRG